MKISEQKEWRRMRLHELMNEFGQKGLSDLLKVSEAYIYQMASPKTKQPRPVSDEKVAEFEKRLQRPGWFSPPALGANKQAPPPSVGSRFELHLPETLGDMARKSLQRIIDVAAASDGALDDFLDYVAKGLEGVAANKLPEDLRPIEGPQLALVKTVSMIGGAVSDKMALFMSQTIWEAAGRQDPDAQEAAVMVEAPRKSKVKASPVDSGPKRAKNRALTG